MAASVKSEVWAHTPRASSVDVCVTTVLPPARAGKKFAMFRAKYRLLPSSMTLKKSTNSLRAEPQGISWFCTGLTSTP